MRKEDRITYFELADILKVDAMYLRNCLRKYRGEYGLDYQVIDRGGKHFIYYNREDLDTIGKIVHGIE